MTEEQDFVTRARGLEPINLTLEPGSVITIIAQLQLALRHPGNRGRSADNARRIARTLQDILAQQDPEIGRYLEKGWHECWDVPTGGPRRG